MHNEGGILDAAVSTTQILLRISATILARELLFGLMLLMLLQLRFDVAQGFVRFAAGRRRLMQLQSTGQTLQLFEHLLFATPTQRCGQNTEQCQAIDNQSNDVADEFGEAVR